MEQNCQEGGQEGLPGYCEIAGEPESYGKCFTHEQLYHPAGGGTLPAMQMRFQEDGLRSGKIGTYSQRIL